MHVVEILIWWSKSVSLNSVSSRNILKGRQSKTSWDHVGASIRLVCYIWKYQGEASRFQGGAKAPSRPPLKETLLNLIPCQIFQLFIMIKSLSLYIMTVRQVKVQNAMEMAILSVVSVNAMRDGKCYAANYTIITTSIDDINSPI